VIFKRSFSLALATIIVIAASSTSHAAAKGGQAGATVNSTATIGKIKPFAKTKAGSTSAVHTAKLTNHGSSALNISGITLAGTNPLNFTQTNTCGTSLAVGASCTISAAFHPTAAGNYSATITIADGAAGSPRIISLTGIGTGSATAPATHTLLTFPQPDLSVTPLYAFIQTATSTLDMTMYELVDTTFQQDLAALAANGVKVRVILDQALEKTSNTPAYTYLNANGVQAVWAPATRTTHQKSITIDGRSSAILTLNLTTRYYNSSRDFAVIDTSASDVAAIQATFNADFTSTAITPPLGDSLVWSPTNSQSTLLAMIGSAKSSLNVENEEMSDTAIVNALAAAAKSGVQVQVTMTSNGTYNTEFTTLKTAGVQVHTYAETAPLYIHAKVILADAGKTGQQAFVGSENFSSASLTRNRELGLTLTDPALLQSLNTTLNSDFAGGTPF
jgi:cardiolipin synthase A/B